MSTGICAENMILLLNYRMNLMLVVLFICSCGLFLFELLFELVKRLEFAMRPARNTVLATLLFESGDANTKFAGGGINGKVETS